MHDTDEHYFDVMQAQDRRMEYIQKRQCFIFTRKIGGCNMYEKTVSGRHFNKIRRNEARHHMNMQPISLYQVKSVSL